MSQEREPSMRLDKSAQALIDFTRQQGNPPLGQVPVEQSRAESNAVRAHLQPDPPVLASVEDGVISGPGAAIRFRIYRAHLASSSTPPVLLFHVGRFVMGDLASPGDFCRPLTKESTCTVSAIDYDR